MSNMDAQIAELFNVVRSKQEEVAAAEKNSKQSWKTTCTIHLSTANPPINIQTASQAGITSLVVQLLQIRDYTGRAEEILGLEKSDKFDGYTYEDWLADCKKRITIIGLQSKKSNLALLEKRLDAIVSPEQRRAMELAAITETLKKQ